MKKFALIGLILMSLSLPAEAGWLVNGVEVKKNSWLKDCGMVLLGAGVSGVTHFLGHVAYYELTGTEWYLDYPYERFREHSGMSRAMAGRAGFLGQTLGGSLLGLKKHQSRNYKNFVLGYRMHNFMEVAAYDLVIKKGGDFEEIDKGGGNGDMERIGFALWSGWNLTRSLKKGENIGK
jgi:hypothetical protein